MVEIDKPSIVNLTPERALPVLIFWTTPVNNPLCWENTGLKVNKAAIIMKNLIINFKVFKGY